MSEQEKLKTTKKLRPPLEGLYIAGIFWFWSIILFYAPIYLGFFGGWRILLRVLGGVVITIGLVGALLELSKLRKSEALGYWSVAILFLAPAIFLHLVVMFGHIGSPWELAIKILVVILTLFGGAFLVFGLCYLFWQPQRQKEEQTSEISQQEMIERKATRRKADLTLIITLLNLATAIIMLVSGVTK